MSKILLKIQNLKIKFEFNEQIVEAVKNSSFEIHKGECLAIVGESGSGKSVTALTIMKLIKSIQYCCKQTFQNKTTKIVRKII